MKPLVLFDVDGTLLLTGGAGMRAMRHAATELFGEGFSWDSVEVSGHLDTLIFSEAAASNRIADAERHHPRFRAAYLERLRHELDVHRDQIRRMPGVREAIEWLRRSGKAAVGLVTGNYSEAVPLKLATIGVDPEWFEIVAFADHGTTRPALVAFALERYAERLGGPVDPSRVVIVGDTPRDIACGRVNGCITFAVATGKFPADVLRDAGADYVVDDLSDPAPLFELVENLSP